MSGQDLWLASNQQHMANHFCDYITFCKTPSCWQTHSAYPLFLGEFEEVKEPCWKFYSVKYLAAGDMGEVVEMGGAGMLRAASSWQPVEMGFSSYNNKKWILLMAQVTSEEAFSSIQPPERMQLIQHLDDGLWDLKHWTQLNQARPLSHWDSEVMPECYWKLLHWYICINTKLIEDFLLECANWSSTVTVCVPLTSQFIPEASAQVTILWLQSHFLCQLCICWHRIWLELKHLTNIDSYLQFLWRNGITASFQAKKIISHLYTIKAGLVHSTKWY